MFATRGRRRRANPASAGTHARIEAELAVVIGAAGEPRRRPRADPRGRFTVATSRRDCRAGEASAGEKGRQWLPARARTRSSPLGRCGHGDDPRRPGSTSSWARRRGRTRAPLPDAGRHVDCVSRRRLISYKQGVTLRRGSHRHGNLGGRGLPEPRSSWSRGLVKASRSTDGTLRPITDA